MTLTALAIVPDQDLIAHVQQLDSPSDYEVELAQRLELAIAMLEEHGLNT